MFNTIHGATRRRTIAGATSVLAVGMLVLAGCSSSDSPTSSSAAPGGSGDAKAWNIVMIPGVSGNEGYDMVTCGAKEIASQNNVNFSVQAAPTFDPAAQIPILQAVIATQPDAIMIAPTDAQALMAPIQAAVDAGIKVILYDSDLNEPSGTLSWVGVDNAAGGKLGAETMAQLIAEKGKVSVFNFPRGTTTTDAREDGFVDGLKQFPGIEYLGPQYVTDPTTAAAQTSALITANPDIAGIYATRQDAGEGVVAGVRNAGKLGKITIVSFDSSPSEVEALQNGDIQALIAQNVHDEGTTAMQVTLDALNGKAVDPRYTVGFFAITQENKDTPEAIAHFATSECAF